MGSIPLPALDVRPPADPSEGIQRMMMMRQMMGQQQLQQQQIQGATLENQIRAQQVKDSQTLQSLAPTYLKKDANGKPTGFDYDGFSADAQSKGVSPATMAQLTTVRKNAADTALANANAGKATLESQDKLNGQAFSHLEGIRGENDPIARQTRWESARQWAAQNGIQGAEQLPPQAPDDKGLTSFEMQLGMHAQAVADAKEQAGTAKTQAETKKLELETNAANPADPNIARQKYQGIIQAIQAGGIGSVSPQDIQWARSHEAAETKRTTQSDTLGVTSSNVSGPAGLSVVGAGRGGRPAVVPPAGSVIPPSGGAPAPNAQQSLVDMIGQYKASPQLLTRMMTKHPDILAAVNQKYPDWNQPDYNARNAMVTKYSSGGQSKEINAINTAMGHLKNLDDAIDALHNHDLTLLNRIGTAYNINVGGKTAEAAFQLIARRVAPEITQAYVTGGGGEQERFANEGDFNVNLPPQTLHNNAAITVKMLRSKVGSLENQWNTTMGRQDFQQRFISPEAQNAFNKFSGQGGASNGGQGDFFSNFGGKKH